MSSIEILLPLHIQIAASHIFLLLGSPAVGPSCLRTGQSDSVFLYSYGERVGLRLYAKKLFSAHNRAAASCFIAELIPVSRSDWSTQEPISYKLFEQFKLDLFYFLSYF